MLDDVPERNDVEGFCLEMLFFERAREDVIQF